MQTDGRRASSRILTCCLAAVVMAAWGLACWPQTDVGSGHAGIGLAKGQLFLVPNDLGTIDATNSTVIHDYGPQSLVLIPDPGALSQSARNRITALDDVTALTYRGWKGTVPGLSESAVAALPDGYYFVTFVGPADESWYRQLSLFGIVKVEAAWPYGLVVHADGRQLLGAVLSMATSHGFPVLRGIAPVPVEARLSGELLRVVKGQQGLGDIPGLRKDPKGRAVVRLFYYNDPADEQRPLDHRAARLAEVRRCAVTPSADLAYGFDDAVLIGGPEELRRILTDIPAVSYAEVIRERQTDDHAQVYYPIAMAVSPPLYTIRPILPRSELGPTVMPEEEIPPWINGKTKPGPVAGAPIESSVVQDWVGSPQMPAPVANFEGLGVGLPGFSMTGAPPDTEGDVGPNHYVQWVNQMFAVFDKNTGSVLYGPANGNTLFTPLGGRCASDNSGDPLVMYDRIADRWFLSQFAINGSPYYQCIAVSQTNNPVTTGWNLYAYSYGSNMNDYGKSGVWPDGYYMMYHMFTNASSWAGTEVCAFDRLKMLAGQPAAQQCFGPNSNYGGLLPSHLQGSTLPPAGSPNYFAAYGASGQLLFWPFHVDWTTSANSTFPFNTPTTITVAAFTDASGTSIPQPGTSNKLDSLGDRLMWRMNYRNFGTYESLVLNHSIRAGAGTGVRWYEIRTPSTTPSVFQQGTFAPSDTTWRWMGSVDMDMKGDIAAGYSGSSSSLYPSLMYTGRLVGDAPGTFPQGETTLMAGSGSQVNSLTRWGDYSTMSIDPTDDCTFWFTSEYLTTNGSFNWHTRIGSFAFPACAGPCTAPGAPSLTSAAGSCSGVVLTWTAGTGYTPSYNIYRAPDACGGAYAKIAGPVAGSNYTDTTAALGTTYAYMVRGTCDPEGLTESTDSNCLAGTRTAGPPDTPAAPTFGNISCTSLTVNWTAAGRATGYNLYRKSGACGTGAVKINTTPITGTSYSDTGRAANSQYSYNLVAVNDCGTSSAGGCASVTTTGVPSAPANASAVGTCAGVTITWDPVAAASSYTVYRGTSCGTVSATFTGKTSPFTDTTGVAGTTYQYWVKAVSASCGTSASSACTSAKKLQLPGTPGTPTFTLVSCTTLTVNWAAASGAVSYDVYRRNGACGTGATKINPSPVTGTSYADAGLAASTSYSYYIVAVNDCGSSGSGRCASATTAAPVPATPGAPGFTNLRCTTLTVSWAAVSGATRYDLYRSAGGCGTGAVIASNLSVTTYNDTGLSSSSAYGYYVVAKNACGNSPAGACGAVTTQALPAAPGAPTFTSVACNSVTVQWTGVSGASSYDLYRKTGPCGAGATKINSLPITGTSFTNTGLSANTQYSYFVVAAVNCGTSGNGACATVTTTGAMTAPGNVAAAGTCAGVTITWDSVAGATSYTVYRGTTCGLATTSFAGRTSPFTDTTAIAGTPYQYWVGAVNSACGNGPNSACVVGTRLKAPSTPAAPTFTSVGSTALTVNWTAASGAASYNLYRKVGFCGLGATKINPSPVTATSYADSGLTAGTKYSYYIVAVNPCGISSNGSCASVTTTAQPQNLPPGF